MLPAFLPDTLASSAPVMPLVAERSEHKPCRVKVWLVCQGRGLLPCQDLCRGLGCPCFEAGQPLRQLGYLLCHTCHICLTRWLVAHREERARVVEFQPHTGAIEQQFRQRQAVHGRIAVQLLLQTLRHATRYKDGRLSVV